MKVKVLRPFRLRGEVMNPGMLLNVSDEAITKLSDKVQPVETDQADHGESTTHPIKWRTKTGREIYLITSERLRRMAPEGKAVFSMPELDQMRGLPDEAIEKIIDVKETFPGAEVEA